MRGPPGSATSVLMVTSSRFSGSRCSAARRLSPILPLMLSAWAITPSSEPYSASHLAAVLGPHFSTPGTLSMASPISASRSTIWCGQTPNFSITAASESMRLPLMVLTSCTPGRTSWAKSLSPVEMVTSRPSPAPCRARVPITSSASTPSWRRMVMPSACTIWHIGSTWARSSSGIGGRLALYGGYRSSRKVLPGASTTKATYSGRSLRVARNMLTTPNSAPVGSPAALVSGGSAWNARYR
ncbi:hypothetical protein NB713_001630 [Xanthomonas sacchari]|nr:hypothetical protein [Xanthomonas sacchari]